MHFDWTYYRFNYKPKSNWLLHKNPSMMISWRSAALWNELAYLLFGVTVAAYGPQVFESSPQQDYEETPKESDHGRGEESPPHPLAVVITGHIWWERDDHIHLGYVDGWVRIESLPVFRHYRLLVTCQPLKTNNQLNWDSGPLGSSSQRPLMPQRLRHVQPTTFRSSSSSSGFTLSKDVKVKVHKSHTRN